MKIICTNCGCKNNRKLTNELCPECESKEYRPEIRIMRKDILSCMDCNYYLHYHDKEGEECFMCANPEAPSVFIELEDAGVEIPDWCPWKELEYNKESKRYGYTNP